MDIEFKQINIKQSAPIIFKIYQLAFNREYDSKVENVEFVENYLKDSTTYIGYLNDKAVCYFAYKSLDNNKIEFRTTGVLPEFQGLGIGKQIIKFFLNIFPNNTIELITHPSNIKALILYLKNGFIIKGWIDNYFNDGEPRLILERQKLKE